MNFTLHRDEFHDKIVMHLEIEGGEYVRANLTPFDRLLVRDCEGSAKASDHLLALETIVRRIEECAAPENTAKP